MNSPYEISVINRFFEAVDMIVAHGWFRSRAALFEFYGYNYRVMSRIGKNPHTLSIRVDQMNALVCGFGLSAHWLLTGEGEMFPDGLALVRGGPHLASAIGRTSHRMLCLCN